MPTSLDENAVRHVAHLARLDVSDEEVITFAGQLSGILRYFEKLNELDTSSVEPTAHPSSVANVLRDDVVLAPWPADTAMHNAPQHRDQFFEVPKILGQSSA